MLASGFAAMQSARAQRKAAQAQQKVAAEQIIYLRSIAYRQAALCQKNPALARSPDWVETQLPKLARVRSCDGCGAVGRGACEYCGRPHNQ